MGVINKGGALYFASGIDNSGMYRDADETKRIVGGITDQVKRAGMVIGAVFGAQTLAQFTRQIVNVRGEMQMLESSFEVLLRGKGVKPFLDDIKAFAIESPLSLTGVSQAAQTLLGFNVAAEETIPIIRQIGDISMGNEERFKSLTLAFAQMSSLGKLMGQDLNQMINAGFNPLQEISERTGKSIMVLRKEMESGAISSQMVADAFASATAEGGKFHGMTQKQADGIKGLQAQIEGATQEMMNDIGRMTEGFITGTYQITKSLIENYDKIGRALGAIITTYGAYRAAVVAVTIAENGWTIASMAKYKWLLMVEKAQKLLNATMLKNPYVAITVAVVGLVSVLVALKDRTTDAEKAQKKLNETLEEAKNRKEALKTKGNELISVLNSETASVYQQTKAYRELIALLPGLKGKSLEDIKSMDPTELGKMLSAQSDKAEVDAIQKQYDERIKNIEGYRKKIKELQKSGGDDASISYYREQLGVAINDTKLLKAQLDEIADLQKEAFYQENPEAKRKDLQSQRVALLQKEAELQERIRAAGDNDLASANDRIALQAIKSQLETNKAALESVNTVTDQAIIKNKEYWESVLDETTKARDKLGDDQVDSEEWSELTKRIKEARQALTRYSTSFKDSEKDVSSKMQKQADLQASIIEQNTRRLNEAKQIELEARQSEVNLMEEGFEKSIALIELEKQRELQSIEERKQAAIKANQDIERAEWERSGSKGVFTAKAGLTEGQLSDFGKLNKQVNERERAGKERLLDELIEKYHTHEQQRNEIVKKYDAERTRLASENIDGKLDKNIEVLNKQEQEELAAFDTQIQAKTSIMTRMFADMSDKSIDELKRIREEAESLWEFLSGGQWDDGKGFSLGITKEQFEDIIADPDKMSKFKKGIDDIRDAIFQLDTPIEQIKEGLKELFDPDLSGTNKQIAALNKIEKGYKKYADAVSLVSGAIGALGDLTGSGALKSVSDGLDDVLAVAGEAISGAQVGAQVGGAAGAVVGGILGAAKGLFTVLSENKKHQEELKRQIQENLDKEYFGQLEVEELYRRKYEWAKKIGETTLNHIKREGEELKKQAAANEKAQSDLWSKLRKEQYKSGEHFKKTGLFGWGKGKIVEEWTSLAGKSWQQIETLASQGKLSEEGMKFYEALKKAKDEGSDIEQMQIDYLERLRETYTGSTYEGVVSSIIDGFKEGRRSAADFADSFEDLMQGAVESSLRLLADENMRQWYEDFAEAGKDGYTKDEIEKAKRDWITLNEGLAEQAKQLEEITGMKIGGLTAGVTGELHAQMTEGTGSQLVGLWNMTAMDTREIKDHLKNNPFPNVSKDLYVIQGELAEIKQNTRETADNTEGIKDQFDEMNEKLENIEKNTKQNNSRG